MFAGAESWEVLSLQIEVSDELHWGVPSLKQLLWLLDEHRLSGAVVITRAAVHFFRFWLGRSPRNKNRVFRSILPAGGEKISWDRLIQGSIKQRDLNAILSPIGLKPNTGAFIRTLHNAFAAGLTKGKWHPWFWRDRLTLLN
jgi:hypothetical protein